MITNESFPEMIASFPIAENPKTEALSLFFEKKIKFSTINNKKILIRTGNKNLKDFILIINKKRKDKTMIGPIDLIVAIKPRQIPKYKQYSFFFLSIMKSIPKAKFIKLKKIDSVRIVFE